MSGELLVIAQVTRRRIQDWLEQTCPECGERWYMVRIHPINADNWDAVKLRCRAGHVWPAE